MFGEELAHLFDAIQTALPECTRADEVTEGLCRFTARKPGMGRGVPAGFLDARARLFRQDALHGFAQQTLGDAVANLHVPGYAKHEFREAMVEERVDVI